MESAALCFPWRLTCVSTSLLVRTPGFALTNKAIRVSKLPACEVLTIRDEIRPFWLGWISSDCTLECSAVSRFRFISDIQDSSPDHQSQDFPSFRFLFPFLFVFTITFFSFILGILRQAAVLTFSLSFIGLAFTILVFGFSLWKKTLFAGSLWCVVCGHAHFKGLAELKRHLLRKRCPGSRVKGMTNLSIGIDFQFCQYCGEMNGHAHYVMIANRNSMEAILACHPAQSTK